MARVINPWVQITGLSLSGQTDTTGTWNTGVDLTTYGVPATASAVLLYFVETGSSTGWTGVRDPDNTTAASKTIVDGPTESTTSVIAPVSSTGTIDIYVERSTTQFWVAGYWERGAVEWFTAGNELTKSTTGAGAFTHDFSADGISDATAVIQNNVAASGDSMIADAGYATATSPTLYSEVVQESGFGTSTAIHCIVPLDGSKIIYGTTVSAATDYIYAGYVRQPISFLYDDNGGPTESPTSATWAAGGYDYGSTEGIGCVISSNAAIGYIAAADTSKPTTVTVTKGAACTAYMHTVKSDGTFNYLVETTGESFDVFWFMGPSPMVYINDATTLDGGEVEQTYPGTANWADGQIDMQNVVDKGALTGQLYVLVELPNGSVASRAVTIGEANTELSMGGIIVLP